MHFWNIIDNKKKKKKKGENTHKKTQKQNKNPKQTLETLTSVNTKPIQFYLLPKIHKIN